MVFGALLLAGFAVDPSAPLLKQPGTYVEALGRRLQGRIGHGAYRFRYAVKLSDAVTGHPADSLACGFSLGQVKSSQGMYIELAGWSVGRASIGSSEVFRPQRSG